MKQTYPKSTYFLCVLNERCKLNYLKENLDENPNHIQNDNLNNDLVWMNYYSLKQAQRDYALMGLEPLNFYKQFLVENKNFQFNSNASELFYEPCFNYFPIEQASNVTTPAELLIVSAKFNKASTSSLRFILF